MTSHKVGTREEHQTAREELLKREKEHTRMADKLAEERRDLPWVPVEKEYRFETEEGTRTLAELFDGRSQLLVYHFMFGPSYEAGCPVCSSSADAVNGVLPHLNGRDVTMLYVSRAPLDKLLAYKQRMGWSFRWVSSEGSDFNFDFDVSQTEEQLRERMGPMLDEPPPVMRQLAKETGTDVAGFLSEGPGLSAFAMDGGTVFHTYSTYARGLEAVMGYYPILDRVSKGRDEGNMTEMWIRRHDEYDR
jgi:predicted dithiol-disulfide oxidoreductase (DUF899 family)